jgi:hypothetical protein
MIVLDSRYGKLPVLFINQLKNTIMKKNMGTIDRIIRVIIAAVIAVLFFTNQITGTLGIILIILGALFLLTSFISFCPLYLPLGLRTNKSTK